MKLRFIAMIVIAIGLGIYAGNSLKSSGEDAELQDISMAIPPEPPKSQTVLLGSQWTGIYRILDLETGIVCYRPTGSGVGVNCFQFEEGPAETPTAHQLAKM